MALSRQGGVKESNLMRGMRLLEDLAEQGRQGAFPIELLKRLKIPRASLFRVLKDLADQGVVEQDPHSGRYRLGRRLMTLGYRARLASPLVEAVQPILREIAGATHLMGELVVLGSPWRLLMVEVWQVEGTPLSMASRPGLFFPLRHLNAPGLCFLSFSGAHRLARYHKKAATEEGRRELQLPRGVPTGLREECARWRRMGHTFKRQRQHMRVSVPVFDPNDGGRLLAALGVTGGWDLGQARVAECALLLRSKARQLEANLASPGSYRHLYEGTHPPHP